MFIVIETDKTKAGVVTTFLLERDVQFTITQDLLQTALEKQRTKAIEEIAQKQTLNAMSCMYGRQMLSITYQDKENNDGCQQSTLGAFEGDDENGSQLSSAPDVKGIKNANNAGGGDQADAFGDYYMQQHPQMAATVYTTVKNKLCQQIADAHQQSYVPLIQEPDENKAPVKKPKTVKYTVESTSPSTLQPSTVMPTLLPSTTTLQPSTTTSALASLLSTTTPKLHPSTPNPVDATSDKRTSLGAPPSYSSSTAAVVDNRSHSSASTPMSLSWGFGASFDANTTTTTTISGTPIETRGATKRQGGTYGRQAVIEQGSQSAPATRRSRGRPPRQSAGMVRRFSPAQAKIATRSSNRVPRRSLIKTDDEAYDNDDIYNNVAADDALEEAIGDDAPPAKRSNVTVDGDDYEPNRRVNYYTCRVCSWKTAESATRAQLTSHAILHSDINRYACPVPNCGKKSRQRSTITSHLKSAHQISSKGILIASCMSAEEEKELEDLSEMCFGEVAQ